MREYKLVVLGSGGVGKSALVSIFICILTPTHLESFLSAGREVSDCFLESVYNCTSMSHMFRDNV